MPDAIIRWLETVSWPVASVVFFLENLFIFGVVIWVGDRIARAFSARPVCAEPEPLSRAEIALGLTNVLVNTAITIAGWQLWRHGVIRFRDDAGVWAIVDVFVLLLTMDAVMYVLHRIAHVRVLYSLAHHLHHRYERVRPITLFALHPAETFAFGTLWLVVVTVYPTSWVGMSAYLTLNVAFGAVGHLGVEPVPGAWASAPVVRHVAGSSFHAQHHGDVNHNFGFYTLIWDRLFGTLRPDYAECYGRVAEASRSKGGDETETGELV